MQAAIGADAIGLLEVKDGLGIVTRFTINDAKAGMRDEVIR